MKKNFWSLCLLLCCTLTAFGQGTNRFLPDEFSKRMNSDTMLSLPDTLALIQNDRWSDLVSKYASSTDPGYTYKSVKNLVRVGINYDKASHTATPYKYRIGLKILCYNYSSPSSPAETRNITLDLSYNADSLQPYTDLSVYKFSGYHQLKVIVTNVWDMASGSPVTLSSWANNFYAEGLVIVQRYDTKPITGVETVGSLVSGNQELEITLKPYTGSYPSGPCSSPTYLSAYKPGYYELEYMYVDDYKYDLATGTASYKYTSGSMPFDFRRNATRVQVTGTTYRIPMVYEHGLILYRARLVRPRQSNYKDLDYGGWTWPDYGTLNLGSSCLEKYAYRISNAHTGDSLNWQYTVNFAEEGKYKHVINYFDGSLKGRQTQTKINSDGSYIVAQEKVYDYEGRPGISSLPIPVQQPALGYRKDLLISDRTAKPYHAADFDSLAACSMPDSLAPLSTTAKANIYYSPLNPDKSGMQQFVPDAKGYPMVQTVFYPDNTDKVLWQGGAGKELQLWKGHGTRYDYVRADQDVLNTLLGTESGKNTFYPRQIVTDPNGQSSFTVMNPAGKVVLSALQGGYPDTTKAPIDSLKNFVRSKLVCSDQLATVIQDTLADGTSMFNTVYNDANGLNSLKYSVLTKPFPTGCGGKYLWAQGNYEVSVFSDCGVLETGLSTTGVVGENKASAADGSSYAATNPALSVSNMAKGKYMVSKKLTFSPYSIRRIVDSFVIANSPACYLDLNYFIRAAVEAETFPCQPSGGPSADDPCDKLKKEMMAQLYPDAKYGPYVKDGSGKFYDEADNSIFSIVGTPLPGGTLAYLPGSTDQCGVPCRTSTGSCATAAGPGCGCGTGAHIYPARCCSECLLRNCKCIRFPNTVKSGTTYTDSTYSTACTGAVGAPTGDWYWTSKNPVVPSTGKKMFGELTAAQLDRSAGSIPVYDPKTGTYKTQYFMWVVWVQQFKCSCDSLHQMFRHEKWTKEDYDAIVLGGWPFGRRTPPGGVKQYDTTYSNYFGVHACTKTVKVPVTTVYYEPAITVKYRYQSDCIMMPSSVVNNGISYTEIKKMPPQQLIEVFNDQIAEALLPLHPEFCKLQSCSETFSATLENITTFKEAEQKGYFTLDSLLAKDPLASSTPARYKLSCFYTKAEAISPAAPAAADKFDYMALSQAYCATGNPTEQNICASVKYANEITNKIFANDQVKQRYFDALKTLYISNRSLYKMKLDNNETVCAPCNAGERMRLYGDPVVPSIYDPYIYTGDGTKVSGGDMNFDGVDDWMRDLFEAGLNGGPLSGIPSEFTTMASSMQASQREILVDGVMRRLANCTLNSTAKDNMRTALSTALSGGQELTPQLIKTIITGAGLSVNDLCHPFLASVKILPAPKAADWSDFTCKDTAYYGGLRNFLNRTEVSTRLGDNLASPGFTSGISGNITLNTSGNTFEAAISTAVGSATVKVEAKLYKTSPTGGTLDESYVKLEVSNAMSGTPKITLNFLAKKYGTDPKLNAVDGPGTPLVFRGGFCLGDDPDAAAHGELTRYSAAVDAACSSCSTAYRYYVWADGVDMMNVAPNSRALQECVTCVDLKQALDSFKANQTNFGYSLAVNHPLAERTLTNYLNYKLGKKYIFGDYQKLMEGCAVSDKVALKEQIADYKLDFTTEAAATTFVDSMNRVAPYIPGYFRYNEGSTHTVLVDYRPLPEDSLLLFKTLMSAGSGPAAVATSRTYGYSTVDEDNLVFVPDACTFSPTTITPALTYNNGGVTVSVWQNGAYSSGGFKRYQFRLSSSATPFDRAKMVADMNAYLQGGGGEACTGSYPFFSNSLYRSADYNTDLKKAYLNLVYTYANSAHATVVANVAPSLLTAMTVPGSPGTPFSGYTFTYDNPWCKGSKDNLYAYQPNPTLPSAGYEGYKLLKDTILYRVRTEGTAKLFPNTSAPYFTSGAKDLAIIRKASGVYWYRFFGPGNKLYNVYLNIPEGKTAPDLYTYSNIRMGAHPRTFQVDVTYSGSTVTCNGYADFNLGASLIATNVVLDKDPKGVTCTDTSDCERNLLENAYANGQQAYKFYFDSVTRTMSSAMMTHLIRTAKDSLVYCAQQQQYQQTLYYYDLAGNLNRTVPPAGVVPVTPTTLAVVNRFRDNPSLYFSEMPYPNPITQMKLTYHKKQSTYQYNALNQLVFQKTPDGGSTYFFYDAAGRQIFSQNSQQRPQGKYNYSLYDKQGRPVETGVITLGCTFTPDPAIEFDTTKCQFYPRNGTSGTLTARAHPDFVQYSYDEVSYPYDTLVKYVHSKSRGEVVYTIYDTMAQDLGAIAGENLSTQENLRSRVAAIRYYASDPPYWYTGSRVPLFSTHYSYDLTGNVQTISYDFYTLGGMGQRYKRVDYEYDQASGKVNMVSYNRGRPDQFYQQYNYDADNRITAAYTSNDGIIWNKDAAYTYYKHGPLAKLQLGDLKIQSLEYAYTIQGWLKAMNGDLMRPDKDMGGNGGAGDLMYARDVVTHALSYFKGDYKPIGTMAVTNLPEPGKELFNGNIAQQTTGIGGLGNMVRTYRYDQMQRLKLATNTKVDDAAGTLATTPANLYRSSYEYDMDGNVTKLQRYDGGVTPGLIDNFTYNYAGTASAATDNNKLLQVSDAVTTTAGGNDLQNGQPAVNYDYDRIGNLMRDRQGAELIDWDRFGKVKSIRDTASRRYISFQYDGKGNRIYKEISEPIGGVDTRRAEYYVRDAGGNILAVYNSNSKMDRRIVFTHLKSLASTSTVKPILKDYAGRTFPTGLKGAMLTEHAPWVVVYTDRPASFYIGIDPTIKSSLLYINDTWIDDMRDWDVMTGTGTHLGALVQSHQDAMPLFTSAMMYPTEGTKLFEWFSSQMPQMATQPVWSSAGQQYIPGNDVMNANNLFAAVNGNPGMQMNVAQQMADALVNDMGMSGGVNTTAFYNAIISDNTLWQSMPLRAQQGPWTAHLRYLMNVYGDPGKITAFYDQWPGSSAALAACTTPEYRLNAVFDASPATVLDDMIDEASDVAIVDALTGSPDITTAEFGEALVTKASVSATDVADAMLGSSGDTFRLAEHHIYGSARLGVQRYDTLTLANTNVPDAGSNWNLNKRMPWYSFAFGDLIDSTKKEPYGTTGNTYTGNFNVERRLGKRYFELSDHTGGILATVLDRKTGKLPSGGGSVYDRYVADIASTSDMYPGGQQMQNRTTEWMWSRFGAQGSMKDDEVYGKGNYVDMGDRHLDVRIWKTPKPDAKASAYPHISPYSYANNNPIMFVDPNGEANVIYIVLLPSANSTVKKETAKAIAEQATKNFDAVGLKTTVVVFDGGAQDFDISKIDRTDAVAVFGDKASIVKYTRTILKDPAFADDMDKTWDAGPLNPEHSENDGTGGAQNNIIPISAPSLPEYVNQVGLWDESNALVKAASHLINHGAGHNSGEEHNGLMNQAMKVVTNSLIMMRGQKLEAFWSSNPGGEYKNIFTNKIPDYKKGQSGVQGENQTFINSVQRRFGTSEHKVNYKFNSPKLKEFKK